MGPTAAFAVGAFTNAEMRRNKRSATTAATLRIAVASYDQSAPYHFCPRARQYEGLANGHPGWKQIAVGFRSFHWGSACSESAARLKAARAKTQARSCCQPNQVLVALAANFMRPGGHASAVRLQSRKQTSWPSLCQVFTAPFLCFP